MNSNVTIDLPAWHCDERGNLCRFFRPTSLLLDEFSGFRDCGEKCRGERDNYSFNGLIFTVE